MSFHISHSYDMSDTIVDALHILFLMAQLLVGYRPELSSPSRREGREANVTPTSHAPGPQMSFITLSGSA